MNFGYSSCERSRDTPHILNILVWWDSELIPRFTKIFENLENFTVIVLGIKNSAFTQNLSPNAHPGAE